MSCVVSFSIRYVLNYLKRCLSLYFTNTSSRSSQGHLLLVVSSSVICVVLLTKDSHILVRNVPHKKAKLFSSSTFSAVPTGITSFLNMTLMFTSSSSTQNGTSIAAVVGAPLRRYPLKLTYASVYDELGYYCQICEVTRDPKQWFYRCNDCDFDCHAHCIVGRYPQVKLGSTCKHEDHAQHLVTLVDKARSPIRFDKRENILPCLKCGEPCEGLVFECRECNINIHREGFCQVTDLESSANQASKEDPSQ
ncbi:hypothetical protein ACLB2K_058567 [Fragaria x ananassa]